MENFNYSRGRSNLRNDMKQITNVKSLGLTRERIVNADIMNSDIMWTLIMKLPHTEVKSQTGLSSLWVLCKRALIGSFSWGCLCNIGFSSFFDVAFDPHISSIVLFVVDRAVKLVLFVSVAEADDSPAPTLRSSLLSYLHSLPLILGNSLPNSCATDGC